MLLAMMALMMGLNALMVRWSAMRCAGGQR